MALVLNDRVKETSTTTGTGSLTLAGAVQDFESFNSGVGTTNTTYYSIVNPGQGEWEVGLGTLSASTTLQRTSVISSSNSDALVTFTSGTKEVFCTFPASKTIDMVASAAGDLVYASSSNIPARLPLGSANQVLTVNSGATAPEWATPTTGASEGFAVAMAIAL